MLREKEYYLSHENIIYHVTEISSHTNLHSCWGEEKLFHPFSTSFDASHTQQQTNKLILNFIHRASRMKRPTHTRQALESMNFILKYESRYSYLFLSFHIHPPSCFRATYECDACETQKRRKCFFLFSKSFPPPHTPQSVSTSPQRELWSILSIWTLSRTSSSAILYMPKRY